MTATQNPFFKAHLRITLPSTTATAVHPLSNWKSALAKPPNYKQEKKRREEMQKKKNEEKQREKEERKENAPPVPKP